MAAYYGKRHCRFYGSERGCWHGDNCQSDHSNPNSIHFCRNVPHCSYAAMCSYRHRTYMSQEKAPAHPLHNVSQCNIAEYVFWKSPFLTAHDTFFELKKEWLARDESIVREFVFDGEWHFIVEGETMTQDHTGESYLDTIHTHWVGHQMGKQFDKLRRPLFVQFESRKLLLCAQQETSQTMQRYEVPLLIQRWTPQTYVSSSGGWDVFCKFPHWDGQHFAASTCEHFILFNDQHGFECAIDLRCRGAETMDIERSILTKGYARKHCSQHVPSDLVVLILSFHDTLTLRIRLHWIKCEVIGKTSVNAFIVYRLMY